MVSGSFPVLCGLCREKTDLTETITIHRSEIPAHAVYRFAFDGDRIEYTKRVTERLQIPKWKYVTDETEPNRVVGVVDSKAGVETCNVEMFRPYTVPSSCVHICPRCQGQSVVKLSVQRRTSHICFPKFVDM